MTVKMQIFIEFSLGFWKTGLMLINLHYIGESFISGQNILSSIAFFDPGKLRNESRKPSVSFFSYGICEQWSSNSLHVHKNYFTGSDCYDFSSWIHSSARNELEYKKYPLFCSLYCFSRTGKYSLATITIPSQYSKKFSDLPNVVIPE